MGKERKREEKKMFSFAFVLSSPNCQPGVALLGKAPVKTAQLLWRTRLRTETAPTIKKENKEGKKKEK